MCTSSGHSTSTTARISSLIASISFASMNDRRAAKSSSVRTRPCTVCDPILNVPSCTRSVAPPYYCAPACPHGGVNAKTIIAAVHDPDQHQYRCGGARKHGADEPYAIEGGHPPHHAWDNGWSTTESPSSAIIQSADCQRGLYVVDAGDGVARRLAKAGINVREIGTIFITHHHDDHTAGLGTLMSVAWDNQRTQPINVFGPPRSEDLVKAAHHKCRDQDCRRRSHGTDRPGVLRS